MSSYRTGFLALLALASSQIAPAASGLTAWQEEALAELSARYLGERPGEAQVDADAAGWVDRLSREIGARLARDGMRGAPAEDVAALAMLEARLAQALSKPAPAQAPQFPPGPTPRPAAQAPQVQTTIADIGKGQEGLRQGIERLQERPLTERWVVTGDINAGAQAIAVPDASDMSSVFGRFRLNVVARAVPASADGRRSEGIFLIQLRSAGGPFDSTSAGRPPAFTPFNDIATDRSRFNEGVARGDVYLGKAFYQQQFFFGERAQYAVQGQLGLVDFSDFFDMNEFANNEVRQFLNGAFVNGAAYKTGFEAPGVIGELRPDWKRGWLRGSAVRIGYAIARTDEFFQSPVWNGELELRTLLRDRNGTFRFGGSLGNFAGAGGVRTFYFSMDQWVSRNFGVFGRVVVNNKGPGSAVFGPQRASISGGVQRRFIDRSDRVSAWGLGISTAWGIATNGSLQPELVFETYYRWQITQNFALTPDFQVVNGAGGALGTHALLGLRANFGF